METIEQISLAPLVRKLSESYNVGIGRWAAGLLGLGKIREFAED